MIKLTKGPIPQVLADNSAEWTKEYLAEIATLGEKAKADPKKYGHANVKSALMKETHKKCAYCEALFNHVTYGDVGCCRVAGSGCRSPHRHLSFPVVVPDAARRDVFNDRFGALDIMVEQALGQAGLGFTGA